MGSTVVVVEHDAETIRAADHVVDLGPGGGRLGGHVISEGSAAHVLSDERSPTARALAETARIIRPTRPLADAWIELSGARAHNLKNVNFRVPVGRMCVVAGVSGSGKSTLVRHVFFPALRRALGLVADDPGAFSAIKGTKAIKRALAVDQSPIGRTPRSVPATFLGVWDEMRRPLRVDAGGEGARVRPVALLVQHGGGRPLPIVRGARGEGRRDGVLAGRHRAVRGLRRRALRAWDAGCEVRGTLDRRRPAPVGRRRSEGVRAPPADGASARDAARASASAISRSARGRTRCRAAKRSD